MTRRYYSSSRNRQVKRIIYLLDIERMAPKEVARELGLSVWSVYRANRRGITGDVPREPNPPINAKQINRI